MNGKLRRMVRCLILALGLANVGVSAAEIPEPGGLDQRVRYVTYKQDDVTTVHVRRGHPDVQDPKLNSHSKLNCITACIQAYTAGADEALMLDPHGFVATCNSTHFFIVRRGEVWTSSGDYCLPGITRAKVLEACHAAGIPAREKNFSLTEVYGAQEAFVTGTFAGLVPVKSVDGRALESSHPEGRPMIHRLQALYRELVLRDVAVDPAGADPADFSIHYDAVIDAVPDHEAVLVLEREGSVSTPGVFTSDHRTITIGDTTSGTGNANVDGDYDDDGTQNGKSRYLHASNGITEVYWTGAQWRSMAVDAIFDSYDAVAQPWLATTWILVSGTGSLPTVNPPGRGWSVTTN